MCDGAFKTTPVEALQVDNGEIMGKCHYPIEELS